MRPSILVALAAGALTLASPALALMLDVAMPDMVNTSSDIVRAKVVQLNSYWLPDPHVIRTDVTVQASEVWKGALVAPATITVTLQGGTVGDITMQVEDQPDMRPGDDVVLFMKTGTASRYQVTNDFQGRYLVQGNQALSPKLVPLRLADLHTQVQRLATAPH